MKYVGVAIPDDGYVASNPYEDKVGYTVLAFEDEESLYLIRMMYRIKEVCEEEEVQRIYGLVPILNDMDKLEEYWEGSHIVYELISSYTEDNPLDIPYETSQYGLPYLYDKLFESYTIFMTGGTNNEEVID